MDLFYITCNEAERNSSLTWNVKQISISHCTKVYVDDMQEEKYGTLHFH